MALFLTGWSFTRGANNQKYTFKVDPDAKFLGILEPRYLEVPASAAGKVSYRVAASILPRAPFPLPNGRVMARAGMGTTGIPESMGSVPRWVLTVDATQTRTAYPAKAPRRILISGWWGLARHVNYMGEIIQGVA